MCDVFSCFAGDHIIMSFSAKVVSIRSTKLSDECRAALLKQRERLEVERARLANVDSAPIAAEQCSLRATPNWPYGGNGTLRAEKAEGPPPSAHIVEREAIAHQRALAAGELR
jgi:hypothetical protein